MKRLYILLIASSLTPIIDTVGASLWFFPPSMPPAKSEEVVSSPRDILETEQGRQLPVADAPLPGRHVTFREAARQCRGAVVAQLHGWRGENPGPPGATHYDETRWKVIERLKGKYEREAVLSLTVQTFPERIREEVPEVGRTYILFSYPENAYQIRKVVAYSEDNLKRAKSLIKGRTQSNKGMNRTRQ